MKNSISETTGSQYLALVLVDAHEPQDFGVVLDVLSENERDLDEVLAELADRGYAHGTVHPFSITPESYHAWQAGETKAVEYLGRQPEDLKEGVAKSSWQVGV